MKSTFNGASQDVGCAAKAATGAFKRVHVFKSVCGTARAVADNKIILVNIMKIFCFVFIKLPP
jgi:hypothetical protein